MIRNSIQRIVQDEVGASGPPEPQRSVLLNQRDTEYPARPFELSILVPTDEIYPSFKCSGR